MRKETFGGLSVWIAGGDDREGSGEGPAVVLLHGFGAPGRDLVPLFRVIPAPPGTRFLFPEAPLELAGGLGESRAWWMIDMVALDHAIRTGVPRDMTQDVPEGLPEAREKVRAMLDEATAALSIPEGGLVLGGFSQGGMLALDVALHDRRPLAGLAILSGTLLAEPEWLPRMAERRGLPVLQSHGERDELLAFVFAERLRDRLKDAELDVTWVAHRGGHEIPNPVLDALGAFLGRVLGT